MFSTEQPRWATCFGILMLVGSGALAQESHLSLDDIDKLARQKLVDSMRKSDGAAIASAPMTASAPVAEKAERKTATLPKRVISVSFVGAYSDMSGAYVLYDYQARPIPRDRAPGYSMAGRSRP